MLSAARLSLVVFPNRQPTSLLRQVRSYASAFDSTTVQGAPTSVYASQKNSKVRALTREEGPRRDRFDTGRASSLMSSWARRERDRLARAEKEEAQGSEGATTRCF